jgi:hypothetical protein
MCLCIYVSMHLCVYASTAWNLGTSTTTTRRGSRTLSASIGYLSIYLSIYLILYISMSIFLYIYLSNSVSMYVSMYLCSSDSSSNLIEEKEGIYLSICKDIFLSIYLILIFISMHLSLYASISLCICR